LTLLLWCGRPACTKGGEGAARWSALQARGPHHNRAAGADGLRPAVVQSSPFEGRLLVIDGFLDDSEYAALLRCSTYAVNVSGGEGQCLPLMEYMSGGKPAVAPRHTGMEDYVDVDNAFPIETSLEPCAWSQDPRPRYWTFRYRINAESLMRAFRESHRVAKEDGRSP